ncbi:MAG: hypothetical protein ACE1ZS_04590 [Candidatus Poribacteria bacterium]
MTKLEQMQRIEACGIVAIIRANSSAELIEVVAAIKEGGVDVIEVTMTTPGALQVISNVSDKYGDEVLVGATASWKSWMKLCQQPLCKSARVQAMSKQATI